MFFLYPVSTNTFQAGDEIQRIVKHESILHVSGAYVHWRHKRPIVQFLYVWYLI